MLKISKVAPAGIEPASSESESEILSIEIRSRISLSFRPETLGTKIMESLSVKNSDMILLDFISLCPRR